MKTKLLKYIRKNITIVEYIHRDKNRFEIIYPWGEYTISHIQMFALNNRVKYSDTLSKANSIEEARLKIMIVVRWIYAKHSKAYKLD